MMKPIILAASLLLSITFLIVQPSAAQVGGPLQKILQNYNKDDPPSTDNSTEVQVGLYVNSVVIDTLKMEYTLSMYFRQAWQDKRLSFDCNNKEYTCDKKGCMRLSEIAYRSIWTPDTFFRNEKRASLHSITVTNLYARVKNDGSVFSALKLSATLSCPMTLARFPLDKQRCPFFIESFGYTADTMHFNPRSPIPIQVDPDTPVKEFSIDETLVVDCTNNYTAGTYSCLEFAFIFRRDIGYYMKQVYIPCFLLVIVSWFSFWLVADGVTRVILGLFASVCTASINYSMSIGLIPKISYVTALDVWTGGCQACILLSLLETVAVLMLHQRASKNLKVVESQEKKSDEIANRVDFFARIVFLAAFLLFTIVYSIAYAI